MKEYTEFAGIITLGERVRVTDPCYNMSTWCAGTVENVLPGEYEAYVEYLDDGEWGTRVSAIIVKHTDYTSCEATAHENIDVGVDSGTCGIFDEEYFEKNSVNDKDDFLDRAYRVTFKEEPNPKYIPFRKYAPELFTQECRGKVDIEEYDKRYKKRYKEYEESGKNIRYFEELSGGTIDGKALVSSSGYGDGGYDCYTGRNSDGRVVAIRVQYIE